MFNCLCSLNLASLGWGLLISQGRAMLESQETPGSWSDLTFPPSGINSKQPLSYISKPLSLTRSSLKSSLKNQFQVRHLLRANPGAKPVGGGENLMILSKSAKIVESMTVTIYISRDSLVVICIPTLQIDCGYDRGLMGRYLTIQSTERWIWLKSGFSFAQDSVDEWEVLSLNNIYVLNKKSLGCKMEIAIIFTWRYQVSNSLELAEVEVHGWGRVCGDEDPDF